MTSQPYAVIFDMDGVLLDSGACHKEAWVRLGEEVGFPFTDAFFQETFGQTNPSILPRMVKGPLAPAELKRLSDFKEDLFRRAARGHISLFPGVVELFGALRAAGLRTGLGTSTPRANVDFIFEELGLGRHLDASVSGDDVKQGKPDPEVFLLCAQRLGVPPQRCLVVEDAIAGVQAAKAGGMKCIAVSTTRSVEDLRTQARPDLILPATGAITPRAVLALLGGEAGRG